jgi:hypothetical protein
MRETRPPGYGDHHRDQKREAESLLGSELPLAFIAGSIELERCGRKQCSPVHPLPTDFGFGAAAEEVLVSSRTAIELTYRSRPPRCPAARALNPWRPQRH